MFYGYILMHDIIHSRTISYHRLRARGIMLRAWGPEALLVTSSFRGGGDEKGFKYFIINMTSVDISFMCCSVVRGRERERERAYTVRITLQQVITVPQVRSIRSSNSLHPGVV